MTILYLDRAVLKAPIMPAMGCEGVQRAGCRTQASSWSKAALPEGACAQRFHYARRVTPSRRSASNSRAVRCRAAGLPNRIGVRVHPEVQEALAAGRGVVALESTIISHGMPWPANVETALRVEEAVRAAGAVPATIAVLGGVPAVGLGRDELERIGRRGTAVRKTSCRDLAAVVAAGADGSTTVAATMHLAAAAGVEVFVTGGLGGVHRGGESSMDVSADLTELGRTRVTVVCAGPKTVLDIPRTLEVLETQGVPVVALAADEFPAFFTPHSGCAAPLRVETPEQMASVSLAQERLGLRSGLVLGVPIPAHLAAEGSEVEAATQRALAEAEEQGVHGAAVTPFLLERIRQLTEGRSLAANVQLILNNARVGALLAVELARLRAEESR